MTAVQAALLIGDRYRLVDRIATGGMGEVWRATDERLGRPVAVKILKPEYADEPAFLERFRAEGRHAALLSHPGIASVFDYGEVDGMAYLVMELVDGEPLSHVLAREGRLPPVRVLDVVGQAAIALQAAHEAGVVHRDVKPGNLLLRPDGVVKVTDFGIARAADAAPITRTGMILGTAPYLSPEQAAGDNATAASDVYALGVVAYEALAGRRPFTGDNPVALAAAHASEEPPPLPGDVPGPVRVLVEQALAKDPRRRPESAGRLGRTALALRATMTDELPAAPFPVAPPAATRPAATKPYAAPRRATRPPAVAPPVASRRRTERRARATLTSVMVVMVVAAAVTVRSCDGAPRPLAARQPARTPTDVNRTATVGVDPSGYLGRPAEAVQRDLRRLGLTPRVTYVASTAQPGSVTRVRPTGPVTAGGTVTISVARAPSPAGSADERSGDDQPGRSGQHGRAHGQRNGKDEGGKGGDD